jgi:NifU-like protein
MWDYSEKLMDHFYNPRNVGDIEGADGVGEVGSLACGDALKLSIRIDKETQKIVDAKFKTFGCGSAIAAASALTEMIKGLTLEEAQKITNQEIADYLGGLPKEKMHCSVMGREALDAAIARYRGGEVKEEAEEEGRIVCKCFGVTEGKIRKVALENHLFTAEEITHYTKAGGGCGMCVPAVEDVLTDLWREQRAARKKLPEKPKMTNIQKIMKIQEIFEHEIKPALKMDGGDIELVDVDGNRVLVALRGVCTECPAADVTLKQYVEKKLQEFVSEDLEVVEVAR